MEQHNETLTHHGVKGMKWGVRRGMRKFADRAKTERESAKEWDEMARYAEQNGKTKRAAKFRKHAVENRERAARYSKASKSPEIFREESARLGRERAKRLLITGVTIGAIAGGIALGKKVVKQYSDLKIGKFTISKGVEFVQGYGRH